jgi:hypothetical protein
MVVTYLLGDMSGNLDLVAHGEKAEMAQHGKVALAVQVLGA